MTSVKFEGCRFKPIVQLTKGNQTTFFKKRDCKFQKMLNGNYMINKEPKVKDNMQYVTDLKELRKRSKNTTTRKSIKSKRPPTYTREMASM